MACVHAVTAKASTTTKNFIALSSSVKSAKGERQQPPPFTWHQTEMESVQCPTQNISNLNELAGVAEGNYERIDGGALERSL